MFKYFAHEIFFFWAQDTFCPECLLARFERSFGTGSQVAMCVPAIRRNRLSQLYK